MNEDIEVYLEPSYLESLIRSRKYLNSQGDLIKKLDLVIHAELDLALLGAEKAKSEVLKLSAKDNLRPIK